MSKLASDKLTSEVISRRTALSILGLAALVLALPGAVLTASDAQAQARAAARPRGPGDGHRAASGAAHRPRQTTFAATRSSQERSRGPT